MVCYQTDKSGRWSCDTLNNYTKACEKHLLNNESISERSNQEQIDAERELNCHSLALLRMLGLKEENKRLKNAVISHGNVIAPFYCLRKDHKPVIPGNEKEGPKTRPVCGANDCQTRRLSYILCMILRELIPSHKTECDATDVLLQSIEIINEERIEPEWTVGSLDVTALYPSLNIETCANVIADRLLSSEIKFMNLQWKEIALYLKYHETTLKQCSEDIREYIPKRKFKGKNPIFENSGSLNNTRGRHAPWIFKREEPSDQLIRNMFCKAIEIIIIKAMSLHEFTFNNKIYRQDKGGAIGLDLVGIIASIYMNHWDEELLNILNRENIFAKVYKRYVDDINLILHVNNEDLNDEKSVMEFIQTKANMIDQSIQVTYDYSKNYEDGKLPVLDIKVWIGLNKEGVYKILHTHYIKEVTSRLVIHEHSAHSPITKFNVCVNEAIRIMKNCSLLLNQNECISHLEYFVKRLIFSGYNHQFRFNVIKAAITKYEKMKQKYNYNEKFFQNLIKERNDGRGKKQKNYEWFSKGGEYKSVMFVNTTPNSELKNRIQKSARKYKIPIKVVETVNTSIKSTLQKSNPFGKFNCGRPDCRICSNGCEMNCRMRGVVYQLMCKECIKILYRGQTARSGYERVNEHFDEYEKCKPSSVLWKHAENHHNGRTFEVGVKILSRNFGDPMKRLITESVLIDELQDEDILNNKKEWSYVRLPRATVITN